MISIIEINGQQLKLYKKAKEKDEWNLRMISKALWYRTFDE